MLIKKISRHILLFILLSFAVFVGKAQQLQGIGYANEDQTVDFIPIYIYCNDDSTQTSGALEIKNTINYLPSKFEWEKYDTINGNFLPYTGPINNIDSITSSTNRLSDGCYRVTFTDTLGTEFTSDPAWVLNNWITAQAVIPDSTSICEYFKIEASFQPAPLTYFTLANNERMTARNENIQFSFRWKKGDEFVGTSLNQTVFDPPASDSPVKYTLEITDEFGCTGGTTVDYISKIPEAGYTADPMSGEAVLEVSFTNNSINWDSLYYWFYRSEEKIKADLQQNPDEPVDSIYFILTSQNPVYEYEWSGKYRVNMVAVKENPTTGNCYDTLYISNDNLIEVLSDSIKIPNFFTPNGDTFNDEFVIFTQSLKSMKVRIFNRWGGQVHSWKYSNIRSSDYTYAHSVWDGRIGGVMASPGVYFYVVVAEGRDGHEFKRQGFVHLFRERN